MTDPCLYVVYDNHDGTFSARKYYITAEDMGSNTDEGAVMITSDRQAVEHNLQSVGMVQVIENGGDPSAVSAWMMQG